MAKTKQTIVVEAGQTSYELDFPYLQTSDIVVSGGYSFTVSGSTINFTSPLTPGNDIDVFRVTDTDSALVQWSDATSLNPKDLDTTLLQNLYAIQEMKNDTAGGGDSLQGQITANRDNISTNADDILTLEGQTGLNTARIATNEQGISDNSDAISGNTGSIQFNTLSIDGNTSELADHEGRISNNELAIGSNAAQIQIGINNDIIVNSRIDSNDNDISSLDGRVDVLEAGGGTGGGFTPLVSTFTWGRIANDGIVAPLEATVGEAKSFGTGQVTVSTRVTNQNNVSISQASANPSSSNTPLKISFANEGKYVVETQLSFEDLPTINSGLRFYYILNGIQSNAAILGLEAIGNIHPSQLTGRSSILSWINGEGNNQPMAPFTVDITSGDFLQIFYAGMPSSSTLAFGGEAPFLALNNGDLVTAEDASFLFQLKVTQIA